jgi:signal peptidase II
MSGDATRLRAIAYGLAVLVLVADRVTTSVAEGHLHDVTHLWGPFGLALSFNSGFAFSLASGRPVLITVLLSVAVVVLAVLVARVRSVPQAVGGGLVLGGAAGNLSERLISGHHGQVADFITLTHWPTFNLADACVTVGVVVLAVALVMGAPHPAPS